MPTLAIIGTGISGLGCAHFLQHDFDLTLFESASHIGGHANTVDLVEPGTGAAKPVDTGFMVFNQVTYPLLTRLFRELAVPIVRTDMSFSVRHAGSGLEFCGSSVNHLFAQRRNLFRPRFWRMLSAIDRFNREAFEALQDPAVEHETLADYVRRRGYGSEFFDLYLVPMSSAVWSTPPEKMLEFPARTLLRFFHNHGFLGLHTQHPWWTVKGGSREYVKRLSAPFRDRIRRDVAVLRVERTPDGPLVIAQDGSAETFDHVIFATHADDSLRLLADPTPKEASALGAFHYQPNTATLHTDTSVMPRARLAWSSWNYEIAPGSGAHGASTATHYWMNRLQEITERENYFVTINRPASIDPAKVVRRIAYAHPLFSLGALRAQAAIPALNERATSSTRTYFAGAWQRYGFHEDGLFSAERLCRQVLGRDPWTRTAQSAAVLVS